MTMGIDRVPSTYVRCEHRASTVVWKLYGSERRHLRECDACGDSVGWVKKTDPSCASAIPHRGVRESLVAAGQANWQLAQAQREEAQRQADAEWWALYNEYLRSDTWAARRAKVIRRENGICQGCMEAQGTQVHHLTYDRVCRELLTDLALLCDACHENAHDKDDDK